MGVPQGHCKGADIGGLCEHFFRAARAPAAEKRGGESEEQAGQDDRPMKLQAHFKTSNKELVLKPYILQ
jgi:hypothetical protein